MKRLMFACSLILSMSLSAMADDPSYFVCRVKNSTMKMYHSTAINVKLSDSLDFIRMDQGKGSLEAESKSGKGVLEITHQDLFAHDEWNSGKIYLSKAVIEGRAGEITIIDQFTDGNERTVLSCSAGDES